MSTKWMEQAACLGLDPDLFFAGQGDNNTVNRARAVCAECPVKKQCCDFAVIMLTDHGTFGSTTSREREKIWRVA